MVNFQAYELFEMSLFVLKYKLKFDQVLLQVIKLKVKTNKRYSLINYGKLPSVNN